MSNIEKNKIVCFGELLIRLSSLSGQMLGDLGNLRPFIGGAEANVAVGLAKLNQNVRFISAIPNNDLGEAALNELRKYNIDTNYIAKENGRMGLYFLSPGAMHRPSEIIYDRENSVFANYDFSKLDWYEILKDAKIFHVSGVTTALGKTSYDAVLNAFAIARELGVTISYDGNYRPKLWEKWADNAPIMINNLMKKADIIFASHRDFELVFKREFTNNGIDKEIEAAKFAFSEFQNAKIICSTPRTQISASNNILSALLFTRNGEFKSENYNLDRIVDRIGSGDAFATGLLYGIVNNFDEQKSLNYGIASACLKHAQLGDFCLNSLSMLDNFLNQDGFDVKR